MLGFVIDGLFNDKSNVIDCYWSNDWTLFLINRLLAKSNLLSKIKKATIELFKTNFTIPINFLGKFSNGLVSQLKEKLYVDLDTIPCGLSS